MYSISFHTEVLLSFAYRDREKERERGEGNLQKMTPIECVFDQTPSFISWHQQVFASKILLTQTQRIRIEYEKKWYYKQRTDFLHIYRSIKNLLVEWNITTSKKEWKFSLTRNAGK